MFRSFLAGIALLGVALGASAALAGGPTGVSGEPEARPTPGAQEFSDEAVAKAITSGADFLWSRQKADGSWANPAKPKDGGGNDTPDYDSSALTALIAYTLLETEVDIGDERMKKALNWLAAGKTESIHTLSLRCNLWPAANMSTRGKYYRLLDQDAQLLIRSARNGGHSSRTADSKAFKADLTDNVNSAHGLLGVWAAARGHVEVPQEYWEQALGYWVASQNADGSWGFTKKDPNGTPAMTAGGMVSLLICRDFHFSKDFATCGLNTGYQPVSKGWDWLERHLTEGLDPRNPSFFHYLYWLDRLESCSGRKFIGRADWRKQGVLALLRTQRPDGSWEGSDVSTALALVFLSHGSHPVAFAKLERPGDWSNRPRDLAILTKWVGAQFCFYTDWWWQVVGMDLPASQWHDAPILCITGEKEPGFSEVEIHKLRTFVEQGGTIFSINEGGGKFGQGMREAYRKMFPQYQLAEAPADHGLYNCTYTLSGKPKFFVLTNGIRLLAVHTDEDLTVHWQLGKVATQRWAFQAACNVLLYATDKGILGSWPDPIWSEGLHSTTQPAATIKLIRLRHGGDFDPEPLAWERFALALAKSDNIQLGVSGSVAISSLATSSARIAALTGTGELRLIDEEKAALKKWVEGGGTLIIDAAGGSKTFAESAVAVLSGMFGADALKLLPPDHAIYKLRGKEIARVRFTRTASGELGLTKTPMLEAVFIKDRPAVIFSSLDLTEGLLGRNVYGCRGYDPESAYKLVRNVLLYAAGVK